MKETITNKDISFALDILNQWKDAILSQGKTIFTNTDLIDKPVKIEGWFQPDEDAFQIIESLLFANIT